MSCVFSIGQVTIHAILESDSAFSPEFLRRAVLPDASQEAILRLPWLYPHWAHANGDLKFVTQAFLIESAGKLICVDTCIGNHKARRSEALNQLETPFMERFLATGKGPKDVDFVLTTHLHVDHVGWNTCLVQGEWKPTFPNARYLISEDEWQHWGRHPRHQDIIDDSIKPLFQAGLVELIPRHAAPFPSPSFTVTEEVFIVPSIGHSPGHYSVLIKSNGEQGLITGDLIHHPAQIAEPTWGSPSDSMPELAESTRQSVLKWAENEGACLIGSHFSEPPMGFVRNGRLHPK